MGVVNTRPELLPASGRAGNTSTQASKTAAPSTSSGPVVPHAVRVARCDQAACAACPEKTRPESVEGECCPRCVALDQSDCDFGQARYAALRREGANVEERASRST